MKSKVFHYESPIDSNALWENIQLKQKNKKRRRLGVWMLGVIILIIASSIFVAVLYTKSEAKVKPIANSDIAAYLPSEGVKASVENLKIIQKPNKQHGYNNTIASKSKTAPINGFVSRSDLETKSTLSYYKKTKKHSMSKVEGSDSNIIKDHFNIPNNQLLDNEVQSMMATNDESIKKFKKVLPVPLNLKLRLIKDTERELKLDFKPSLVTAKKSKNSQKIVIASLGVYFNYSFNQRNLSAKTDSFIDYQVLRENNEQALDVYRGGFNIKFKHRKKDYYGKIGLEYQQITEKLQISFSEINGYLADNQLVQIQIQPDGSMIEVFDTATITEIKTFNNKKFNRYRSIEFPILLGYEFPSNSNWRFFGESGISISLYSNFSGEILDTTGLPYDLNRDTKNWFTNNTGIAILGNFGITHRLADNWDIWVGSSIKYHISRFSTEENPLNQRYWNMGLSLGMTYNFD